MGLGNPSSWPVTVGIGKFVFEESVFLQGILSLSTGCISCIALECLLEQLAQGWVSSSFSLFRKVLITCGSRMSCKSIGRRSKG